MTALEREWEQYKKKFKDDPHLVDEIELAFYSGAMTLATLLAKRETSLAAFLPEMQAWLQRTVEKHKITLLTAAEH